MLPGARQGSPSTQLLHHTLPPTEPPHRLGTGAFIPVPEGPAPCRVTLATAAALGRVCGLSCCPAPLALAGVLQPRGDPAGWTPCWRPQENPGKENFLPRAEVGRACRSLHAALKWWLMLGEVRNPSPTAINITKQHLKKLKHKEHLACVCIFTRSVFCHFKCFQTFLSSIFSSSKPLCSCQ